MGQLYSAGADAMDTTGLNVVNPGDVQPGHEYIWEYGVPAITFSIISPDTMESFVRGMLNLGAYIKENAPGTTAPPVTITGISIDTSTGNIWVRGRVNAVPSQTDSGVLQAGVNPWAIAGLIAGLFAIIGAAVVLRYVYEIVEVIAGTYQQPGGLDPCTNPGIVNEIKCLARESTWFVAGVAFGIIVFVIFLLIKFGPKEGAV